MVWSVRIATLWGTALRVHVTFVLLLAWIGWVGWQRGGAEAATDGIVFVLLVFLCVALHEGGHALAAGRYGIRTPDITLLPIGGLARLERMPERPGQEMVVAAAGPLVNVAIAGLLFAVLGAQIDGTDLAALERAEGSLVARLIGVNVMLVLFNLLPAFPLDGGRMLRALLAMRLPRARATRIAARVGQGFGLVFAALGLLYNPLLLLIAVFVFLAADAESRLETERERAVAHRFGDVAVRPCAVLRVGETARRGGQLLLATVQQQFPVLDEADRLEGVVTRARLVEALRGSGPDTPLTAVMVRDPPVAAPEDPLLPRLDALLASPAGAIVLVDADGRCVGCVSAAEVCERLVRDGLAPRAGVRVGPGTGKTG